MSGLDTLSHAPLQEGDTERATENASLAGENAQFGGAEKSPSNGGLGSHLALALATVLGRPGATEASAAKATIFAFSAAERVALLEDSDFWTEPFWAEGGRDSSVWRELVDPLDDVAAELGALPIQERLARAESLRTVPGLCERLLSDFGAGMTARAGLARDESQELTARLLGKTEPAAQESATSSGWLGTVDPVLAVGVERLRGLASASFWSRALALGDLGPALLSALLQTRDALGRAATAPGVAEAQVAQRVQLGLREVGERYEAGGGSLLQLLESAQDPYTRRRAAQLLGREADVLGRARLQLHAGGDAAAQRRKDALIEQCGRLGGALAAAVVAERRDAALGVAMRFDALYGDARQRGDLVAEDLSALHQALEAGYAPLGGDLRHGVASLEKSDGIFKALRLRSTALALKAKEDTRSDTVVQAEYDVDEALAAVFGFLATGDEARTRDRLLTASPTLLSLATPLQPASPLAYINLRYKALFGVDLAQHLARAPLPAGAGARLAGALGLTLPTVTAQAAGARPPGEPLPDLDARFFTVDRRTLPGADPSERTPERVQDAVAAWVDLLDRSLAALRSWHVVGGLSDPQKLLLNALQQLRATGGEALVLDAFEGAHGAPLELALREAQVRGETDEATSDAALQLIEEDDVSTFGMELRGHAAQGDWDAALLAVNATSFGAARRKELLADGETLAYLRERAPSTDAWDLFYRSATGELADEELSERDGGLSAWSAVRGLEAVDARYNLADVLSVYQSPSQLLPTLARRALAPDDPEVSAVHTLLTGDHRTSYGADHESLLAARDQGLSDEELQAKREQRTGSADARYRLDRRYGGGDDRIVAEETLRGRGHVGELLAAGNDRWGGLGAARAAIVAMSDEERAVASADPRVREQLFRQCDGDRRAFAQLVDLLEHGEASVLDAIGEASGSGADRHLFVNPWHAVRFVSKLPHDALFKLVSDPQQVGELRAAASFDDGASAELQALLAAANLSAASQSVEPSAKAASNPDPRVGLALCLFAARQHASLMVAGRGRDPHAFADVLYGLADEVAVLLEPDGSGLTSEGWTVGQLDAQLRPAVDALVRGFSWHFNTTPTGADIAWVSVYSSAVRGEGDVAVKLLYELGADDGGLLVQAVKRVPDAVIAREWGSLLLPTRDGVQSLSGVYASYRQAREAAQAAPDDARAAEERTAAEQALRAHPVDLTDRALEVSVLDLQDGPGNFARDLRERDRGAWESVQQLARERVRSLPAALVREVIGASDEDADVVWTPTTRAALVVAATEDRAEYSLAGTSWGFEALSKTDNQAAGKLALFAQSLAMDRRELLSEDDLERLIALSKQAGADLAAYDQARETAADLASWAASLAATAVAAAITGPAAVPSLVSLLTTAAATAAGGIAGIGIHEAVLGEQYDAEAAAGELVLKLISDTASDGLSMAWTYARTAGALRHLQSGRVEGFLGDVDAGLRQHLGPVGVKAATSATTAALLVPWRKVSASAWVAVDEAVLGNGWSDGLQRGLLALDAQVDGMPEEVVTAVIAELAATYATAEVNLRLGASPRKGAASDVQLKAIPREVLKKFSVKLAKGGATAASAELMELLGTGDEQVDEARVNKVLQDAVKEGFKGGVNALGVALGQARAESIAQARKAEAEQKLEAQEAADGANLKISAEERAAFLQWVGARRVRIEADPEQWRGDTPHEHSIVRVHERFRAEVWDVVNGRLAMATEDDGGRFRSSEEIVDAYRAWILKDPLKARDRMDKTPLSDFARLRESTRELVDRQRGQGVYSQLRPVERAWFEAQAQKQLAGPSASDAEALRLDDRYTRAALCDAALTDLRKRVRVSIDAYVQDAGGERAEVAKRSREALAQRLFTRGIDGEELALVVDDEVKALRQAGARRAAAG